MRRWAIIIASVALVFIGIEFLLADEWEDVEFIEMLAKRGKETRNDDWFKLAREYGMPIVRTQGRLFKKETKTRLAQTMDAILSALTMIARQAGNEKDAAIYEKERQEVQTHIGGDKSVVLAKLERDLLELQGAAASVEVEVDKKVKEEKSKELQKKFETLNKEIEATIKKWREDIAAKYPDSSFWPYLPAKEKEGLPDELWARDYLEFIYARSFIYQAKIVTGEERTKRLNTAIKKFLRFTKGIPEFDGDRDPESTKEFVPQTEEEKKIKEKYDELMREMKELKEEPEPEPRATFPILEYFAFYWMARAYFDLGNLKDAMTYAKYALYVVRSVEPTFGKEDIKRVVEVVLKAHLMIGQILKKEDRKGAIEEAVDHFYKALSLTGQPIDPARAEEIKFTFPDVYTFDEGQFIAMELGESLVTLKRYVEGMSVVYKIYHEERSKRSPTGQPSEKEVVAAHWMAKIYDAMGASVGILPVGHMFAVAEGYYSLKNDEKAMNAYRLAICAPGTEEERYFFTPVAMFRLGVLLQDNKRFMEAYIVFTELVKRYKGHQIYGSLIVDAARAAIAAARKFSDADEFGKKLYEDAKAVQKEIVPAGADEFNERLRLASQDIQQKRYDKAIEGLQGITETFEEKTSSGKKKVIYDNYPMARALLGSAYVLKFGETVVEKPDPQLLVIAAEALNEALTALASRQQEDPLAEAMARRYLGEVYTNPHFYKGEKKKWAQEAIKVLQVFERKFRDVPQVKEREYPMYAKARLIDAYRLAGELDAAERYFDEFAKEYSTSRLFEQICFELFKAYKQEGKDMQEKGQQQYAESLFKTAGKMLREWLAVRQKGGKLTPDDQMWVALQQAEIGQYLDARKVFNDFLRDRSDIEKMNDNDFALFLRAKTGIAQCFAEEKKFKQAAETLDQLRVIVKCKYCSYRFNLLDPQKFVDDEEYRHQLYNEKLYGKCPKEGVCVKCDRCKQDFFVSQEKYESMMESYNKARKENPGVSPELLKLEMIECPKCKSALNITQMTESKCLIRELDGDFAFQFTTANHYWNAFKASDQRDANLRDRAFDILTRLYKPLEYAIGEYEKRVRVLKAAIEKGDMTRQKEYETYFKALGDLSELLPKVIYYILVIYFNKGEFDQVVGYFEEKNNGEPITDEKQFESIVPWTEWRDKFKELYTQAKEKTKR